MERILVLEDHQPTREWLVEVVKIAFTDSEVDEAANLSQAYDAIAKKSYTLAMIDLNLPDGSGNDLIEKMAAEQPDAYLVVATIYDDDKHVYQALQAGAHGYILKEERQDRILSALSNIKLGQPPLSASIARKILRHFKESSTLSAPAASPAPVAAEIERLTEREAEVLSLVAKGFSRTEVANYLGISANTAASHVKAIYRKLNVSSRAEAAIQAQKMGLS
ncbi:MAG: response regulator transcription factor [Reinekea sp.]|nr:response regulator transcription factor [Reinekea sp.]